MPSTNYFSNDGTSIEYRSQAAKFFTAPAALDFWKCRILRSMNCTTLCERRLHGFRAEPLADSFPRLQGAEIFDVGKSLTIGTQVLHWLATMIIR